MFAELEHAAVAFAHSTPAVATAVALYVCYVVANWGVNRGPPFRRSVLVAYNVCIALTTLLYAGALYRRLWAHLARHGLWHLACAPDAITGDAALGRLLAWHSVMRVVEFADTVFIVYSRRPLTLLHTWHHAATLALAHVQLIDATPLQWLTIGLNAAIHVGMFSYYAAAASGARIPPAVKRAVTYAQIAQFVVLLSVYGAMLVQRTLGLIECYATPRSTFTGLAVLASYLVLFVRFARQTYGGARADAGAKAD